MVIVEESPDIRKHILLISGCYAFYVCVFFSRIKLIMPGLTLNFTFTELCQIIHTELILS